MLAAAPGTAPVQLTQTGGQVDEFRWLPGGRTLIYKAASGSTPTGDLYLLDVASHVTTWQLGRQVMFFNLSPDGSRYVTATPIVTNGNLTSYQILIGTVGQPGSTATQSSVGGPNVPVNQSTFFEGPQPRPVYQPGEGLYWLTDAIYLSQFSVYTTFQAANPSAAGGYRQVTDALFSSFQGVPANSQITLALNGFITLTCGGSTRQVFPNQEPGRPALLIVTADTRTGLTTDRLSDGGIDIYQLGADGGIRAVTTDHVSGLPRWQPGI